MELPSCLDLYNGSGRVFINYVYRSYVERERRRVMADNDTYYKIYCRFVLY